ncbi:MAG: response regulator transcription factor [Actinobacteria bacterium]|nr:response regulator transcription factor [Actinomycetota bacterium]
MLVSLAAEVGLPAQVCAAAGEASSLEAERLQVLLATSPPIALQLRALILDARLRMGQVAAVRTALGEMSDYERNCGELRDVLGALALLDGDPLAAADVVAPAVNGSAPSHHVGVIVHALVVDALARDQLGDTRASGDALERALDLAEPDALVIAFLIPPCDELLARYPRHCTSHGGFIAEILDVLAGGSPARGCAPETPPLDELSDAELRVLRYLPTNPTAAGIAAQMLVSANTVKTHMRHIYAKLGTHNRTEAVQRARRLGLVGRSARRG